MSNICEIKSQYAQLIFHKDDATINVECFNDYLGWHGFEFTDKEVKKLYLAMKEYFEVGDNAS